MKFIRPTVCFLLCCLLAAFICTGMAEETSCGIADVDFNGNVEASDARLILRFAVELEIPTDDQRRLADISFDGHITAVDARLALRMAVGLDIRPNHIPGAAATCTEAQLCTVCHAVIAAPLGHDLIDHAAKAPSCTEIGWNKYQTCSRCDFSTYAELPALGHDLIDHAAKAPSCTEIGWDAYQTCSRCDFSTYKELPALGHDLIDHAAKAPTCTEIGWDAYQTCSRCDFSTYKELPALGHDLIEHAAKAPTCTEIGWDAYQTCSRCDFSTYAELPKLPNPPANLRAVPSGNGAVTLLWDPVEEATSYQIYRAVGSDSSYRYQATITSEATYFSVSKLQFGLEYSYYVIAASTADGKTVKSPPSEPVAYIPQPLQAVYPANKTWADVTEGISFIKGGFLFVNGEVKDSPAFAKKFSYSADYIPVHTGELWGVYTPNAVNGNFSANARGGLYDRNKNWIGFLLAADPTDAWNYFIVPDGVSFIRVNRSNSADFKLVKACEMREIWRCGTDNYYDDAIMNNNGIAEPQQDCAYTEKIQLTPGQVYFVDTYIRFPSAEKTALGVILDEHNNVISPLNDLVTAGHKARRIQTNFRYYTFIAPENAAYAIISIYNKTNTLDRTRVYACDAVPMQPGTGALRNLKIDYIGDSLTYWDQWTVQTEASFGLIYHNLGVGSKCLCGEPYPKNPRMWEDSILNAVIAHDPDIVTIMGGANDFGQMHPIGNVAEQTALPLKQKDKNTFAGAYSYIVERLLQWKPSLRIILMEFVTDHMEEKNRLGISGSDYNLCANEIAAHYGLEIARTQEAGAFSHETYAELLIDRVHPSFAGAQIYARTLSNILSESGEE